MPKDKLETCDVILACAKKEFLAYGFEKASLRSIASCANISATAIYRHFDSKEALFKALLAPVLEKYNHQFDDSVVQTHHLIQIENGFDSFWVLAVEQSNRMLEHIYAYFDEYKLLICRSEGTIYHTFLHDLVEKEVCETQRLLKTLRDNGYSCNDIEQDDLHAIYTGYIASITECVVHDYPKEKAFAQFKVLMRFFHAGWKALLGLA